MKASFRAAGFALSLGAASMASAQAQSDTPSPGSEYSSVVEANRLALAAKAALLQGDPRTGGKLTNAREAIRLFNLAIGEDPECARCFLDLARSWLQMGYSDPDGLDTAQVLPPAQAALKRSIQIDENLIEARLLLASLLYSIEYDWTAADREYRRALQIEPNNAAVHIGYAAYLGSLGRFKEALDEASAAENIAPSLTIDITLARISYWKGDYEAAISYCRRGIEKRDNAISHLYMGFSLIELGRADEAIVELRTAAAFSSNAGAQTALAYGLARAGRNQESRAILDDLQRTHRDVGVVAYRLAAVHVALGEFDQAIRWIETAIDQHDSWISQIGVDPVMIPLRSDPRFQLILERLGLIAVPSAGPSLIVRAPALIAP